MLKSRYGGGKTTFLQKLIKKHNTHSVLFITYRQTLARDISTNFSQLGFKNYLDACDDPDIWDAPRLILQIHSLMNLMYNNGDFINDNGFDLKYDMVVLDESER